MLYYNWLMGLLVHIGMRKAFTTTIPTLNTVAKGIEIASYERDSPKENKGESSRNALRLNPALVSITCLHNPKKFENLCKENWV